MDETESLITQVQQGDDAAVEALLEQHLDHLRAYIRLRMGSRVRRWDTESDLAQSVCIEVLRNMEGFEYRGDAAFRHWLFTMARRKLAQRDEYLKAEKRDVDLIVSNAAANDSKPDAVGAIVQRMFQSPSQIAIRGETMARIEKALDRMSEETREIILMSRLAGVPTADIAATLGKEPSTVRSALSRGLAALGRALA